MQNTIIAKFKRAFLGLKTLQNTFAYPFVEDLDRSKTVTRLNRAKYIKAIALSKSNCLIF